MTHTHTDPLPQSRAHSAEILCIPRWFMTKFQACCLGKCMTSTKYHSSTTPWPCPLPPNTLLGIRAWQPSECHSGKHHLFLPLVRLSNRKCEQQSSDDGTERPSHATVGGTKALFWRMHHRQLQADALAFLLNRGWGIKIDTGIYWKPRTVEVSQI